ncbi:MAG: lactate permease LctP family transporter [Lachnospiraceae bacterium]|nr:lactate permease LctP family transporter [Lachnospiraceae bacterium]
MELLVQFLLGLLPIIWLVIALTAIKLPGYISCSTAILFAAVVAVFYKTMPVADMATAALDGALNALWPILLVIIAALFVYNLSLKTGGMETIKKMLSGVSKDKRILALIIGFGFGFFMEGMAGFGTAVAIPAGILVAMGFDPLPTVLALLVVNGPPTAFGSVGVPTVTLASVTGLSELALSSNTIIIEAVLMFISPFIMVCIIGKGVKALKGIWHIVLLSSMAMIIPEFVFGLFVGPQLPDIIGSIVCLGVTVALALLTRKRSIPEEYRMSGQEGGSQLTAGEAVRAWSPFILIAVLLVLTSSLVPFINQPLSTIKTTVNIFSGDPSKMLSFTWINTPGVWIIISGIIGGLIQGMPFGEILKVFFRTAAGNWKTIITICSVLATAKIMQFSGMTMDVATTLVAVTGRYFPFLSPLVGILGAFVTGSGTSTCVLFGPMQAGTAEVIGIAPQWLAASNSLGAGIGKMISPSNVAIGAAAAGLSGKENKIIGTAFKYVVVFAVISGLLCFFIPKLFGSFIISF